MNTGHYERIFDVYLVTNDMYVKCHYDEHNLHFFLYQNNEKVQLNG